MGIASDAEKKASKPELKEGEDKIFYAQAREQFSALTYEQVSDLLVDGYQALETKILLENDSAGLNDSQLIKLLTQAKELSELASKCYDFIELRIKANKYRCDK